MLKPIAKLGSGYGATVSPSGNAICITANSAPARIVSLDNFEQEHRLVGQANPRKAVYLDNGNAVVVFGFDSGFSKFCTSSGERISRARSKHIECNAHEIGPQGQFAVTAQRGKLALYDLKEFERIGWLPLDDDTFALPVASAFDAIEENIAVLWTTGIGKYRRCYVSTFSTRDFKRLRTVGVKMTPSSVSTVACGFDGSMLRVSLGSSFAVIDTKTGKIDSKISLPRTNQPGFACAQSMIGAGRSFCASGKQAFFFQWITAKLSDAIPLPIDGELYGLEISLQKDCLITCTGKTHVWSLTDLSVDRNNLG